VRRDEECVSREGDKAGPGIISLSPSNGGGPVTVDDGGLGIIGEDPPRSKHQEASPLRDKRKFQVGLNSLATHSRARCRCVEPTLDRDRVRVSDRRASGNPGEFSIRVLAVLQAPNRGSLKSRAIGRALLARESPREYLYSRVLNSVVFSRELNLSDTRRDGFGGAPIRCLWFVSILFESPQSRSNRRQVETRERGFRFVSFVSFEIQTSSLSMLFPTPPSLSLSLSRARASFAAFRLQLPNCARNAIAQFRQGRTIALRVPS